MNLNWALNSWTLSSSMVWNDPSLLMMINPCFSQHNDFFSVQVKTVHVRTKNVQTICAQTEVDVWPWVSPPLSTRRATSVNVPPNSSAPSANDSVSINTVTIKFEISPKNHRLCIFYALTFGSKLFTKNLWLTISVSTCRIFIDMSWTIWCQIWIDWYWLVQSIHCQFN